MAKAFIAVSLLALLGCSGVPPSQGVASACQGNEASYQCQIERYQTMP
jgi:hypothetical protein